MALATRHLSRSVLAFTRRIPTRRRPTCPIIQRRPFHSTLVRGRDGGRDNHGGDEPMEQPTNLQAERDDLVREWESINNSREAREERAQLTAEEQAEYDGLVEEALSMEQLVEDNRQLNAAVAEVDSENPEPRWLNQPLPKSEVGIFAEDEEDDEFAQAPDGDEWNNDDIPSPAHAQLEQHREAREYARLAAWELPMLSKLAKPFQPPRTDQPLRFRYTHYMGEHHPAERKVVVEFCTADLLAPRGPLLSPAHRAKLIKLLGPRYNPSQDLAKMSCERFETAAQNKRYLGDLVDSLVREAQDTADTFDDVPFDFRHHRPKTRPTVRDFPDRWRMTEARKRQLLLRKEERLALEEDRVRERLLVDGVALLEGNQKTVEARETQQRLQAEALRVEAQKNMERGRTPGQRRR